jgi:hypothetical protein
LFSQPAPLAIGDDSLFKQKKSKWYLMKELVDKMVNQ